MNNGDSKDVINKYVDENKFSFLIGMGTATDKQAYDIPTKYGVMAYPTNYVIDSTGKVIWRGVGFNEEAIRIALGKLGVK